MAVSTRLPSPQPSPTGRGREVSLSSTAQNRDAHSAQRYVLTENDTVLRIRCASSVLALCAYAGRTAHLWS